jgi:NADH-quinone oxidoreductase subunit N
VLAAQAATGDVYGSGINTIAMLGLVLSIVGICFKIAAVPMHFYTPDVYQGASASIAGFLAFVPKAAGFFAILLLTSTVGWHFGDTGMGLPVMLRDVLWIIAVLTMTVGNVLAVLQSSVKRILAYSSIAHSGYMLVGVIAGPGALSDKATDTESFARNGVAAVLFYLVSYGLMSVGAFAVLAGLERRNAKGELEEPDHIDDLRGLCKTVPALGWTMVICAAGLLGLPPLLGFFGKLPLFSAGIRAGEVPLVLILGVNSAIAAYYYLRLMYVPYIDAPDNAPNRAPLVESPFQSRRLACAIACLGVIFLSAFGGFLAEMAASAARLTPEAASPIRAAIAPAVTATVAVPDVPTETLVR